MNTRRTRIRHRARRRGSSRLVVSIFGGLIALGLLSAVAVIGWIVITATTGPNIDDLKARNQGISSEVFASDGTSLGYIQSAVVRQPIASDLVPETIRQATVAVEDQRFYQHKGVDFEGVVRAAARNLTSGKTVEGGSTLTMQLVRTLYAGNEKSITRKIREAKLAEEYENKHNGREGKRYILNQYLNNVPYGTAGGQEIIGIQAAARAYYNKPARRLTLAEAAMIAGLPQAPTSYNPLINPKAALARRNDVLTRMAAQGMITDAQAQESKSQALGVKSSGYYSDKREGYVFDYVKKQLAQEYPKDVIAKGGLKIYTSIDLRLQKAARTAMKESLNIPNPPLSAIVTTDPSNGDIVAMASSTTYSKQARFNLAADIKRRPGSTFKTMALMAAVRRGVRPESTYYTSKPLNIPQPGGAPIVTKTYGGTYGGSMNLVKGTLTSDNTVYMQLALDIGPLTVKKAAVDMGIKSKLKGYPAESLGGLEEGVTPLEMSNAYATIASGGYKNTPNVIRRVKFPNQSKSKPFGKRTRAKTFQNGVTGEVTKILEQNVQAGTGTRAQISCPAAGKTGTTDDFRDAWFVGFTPKLSTSVWVGYIPEVEMRTQFQGGSVAGGTFPSIIWGDYMKRATAGKDCGSFKKITEPVTTKAFTGKFARSGGAGTGDDPTATTPTGGTTPKVDEAVPNATKKKTPAPTKSPTQDTGPADPATPGTPDPATPDGGTVP